MTLQEPKWDILDWAVFIALTIFLSGGLFAIAAFLRILYFIWRL